MDDYLWLTFWCWLLLAAFYELFSKLRNCAIFFTLLFSLVSWSHTHTQKAYKAARTLARAQITVGQFSTFALTAWKYATFFICFCFTKFCDIKFFLLSLSLLFPARSCCCCCGCGPALYLSLCVRVCMCVCSCVLAFYDPIWPPSVAYVFSLPSSISLSRALSLWLWFCVGFMNYIDFYAVAYYFSLLFLFVYFFFCSSAFFLPFFLPPMPPCLFWLS